MSDYLTTLPVELLHKILDNVPSVDILSSICFINKRLRSISLNYPRFQLDFGQMDPFINVSHFDTMCTQLLHSTSQVISLTLFENNHSIMSTKNNLFFSRFKFIDTAFPNLRSLTLTWIEYDEWCLMKTRLPPLLVNFSICLYYPLFRDDSSRISDTLSELLFLSSYLKRLSITILGVTGEHATIRRPNSTILSSVECFYIKYIRVDLLSLLAVAPMLHTVEGSFHIPKLHLGDIYPRLLYLEKLIIKLLSIKWTELTILLSLFPRLIDLRIHILSAQHDMADGFAWEKLLKSIKHFEFQLIFDHYFLRHHPISLDSFRTKFWLEEKKWSVIYKEDLSGWDKSILYSNSSAFIKEPSRQTIEITTSEPMVSPYVHYLIINDQYIKYSFLHHYTRVQKSYLLDVTTTTPLKNYLTTWFDTSYITNCDITSKYNLKSLYECIEFLQSLSHLKRIEVSANNLICFFVHQWPNIIDLNIENDDTTEQYVLNSADINALCHSFPQIKTLDIHSSLVTDLAQLINKMKTKLTGLIIQQPSKIGDKNLITRQWIEQNTDLKNFYYHWRWTNVVRIWL